MSWRPERVAEMVHSEIARRLLEDVQDPELTPISITRVEMTRDLGRATVWWLPLGGGAPSETLVEAVERAARKLRGPIGRALRLRTAPELHFVFDEKHEEAIRVTAILEEIGRERETRDDGDGGPS